MILLVCGVILGQLLAMFGACLAARWYIERQKATLYSQVMKWTLPEGDKPSQFAVLVDAAGETVGRAAARAMMQYIGTANSHAAKAANGIVDEVNPPNPIMALLGGVGRRGKGAGIMQLAQMLMPLMQGHGAAGNGGSEYAGRRHRDG